MPITKNINSIIEDTKKLNSEHGIIAFVLFPIPLGDNRWEMYLTRIMEEAKIKLSSKENCTTICVEYEEGLTCDLVVCTYMSKYYKTR